MEAIYHYLWKYRMKGARLRSTDGKEVTVLNPGLHNNDAGPDFSHARVRIGDTVWAGNVEIHVKASDWHRHGHDSDLAYDSVALHVVAVDDARIHRRDGSEIPQVTVLLPPGFYQKYADLTAGIDAPRCLPDLTTIPHLNRVDWLESLGVERLVEKASRMRGMLESLSGDWDQTLFITLSRALGFGLNGVPFEMMARSLPLNFIHRHSDNPFQIEALVFGQAGMLDSLVPDDDDYYQQLRREYSFLAAKYSLAPIRRDLWKYARTRPHNFPHRRLAILASMLAGGWHLRDILLDARGDEDRLRECFGAEASRYWRDHPDFGRSADIPCPCGLSDSSVSLLLINVAAPFYYACGGIAGDPELAECGIDLLRGLPPERNSVITHWKSGGLKASNAFESQALLFLRKNYCDRGRCLDCRFGHKLLDMSAREAQSL